MLPNVRVGFNYDVQRWQGWEFLKERIYLYYHSELMSEGETEESAYDPETKANVQDLHPTVQFWVISTQQLHRLSHLEFPNSS